MPPLLRLGNATAIFGIGVALVGGTLGGQWMRFGVVAMGAGLLPLGVLVVTNFRGESAQLATRLTEPNSSESTGRFVLTPSGLRYGFGCFVLIVGIVFLVTGLMGGPGVTKPGGLF